MRVTVDTILRDSLAQGRSVGCATIACDPEPHRTEITVDMATQALLKSFCYDPRGRDTVQQTKAGLRAMALCRNGKV